MNSTLFVPRFSAPSLPDQLRGALLADALKLRRTAALRLALGLATLPVLVIFLVFYFRGASLLTAGQSPWVPYLHNAWRTEVTLLLPLFVVLLTSLVVQVEHRSSAWKHLHTLPVTRGVLFFSKLLVLLGLSLLAQVLHAVLLLLTGWLLGLLQPDLGFQLHAAPVAAVATAVLKIYAGTAGILAVQYVASLAWRSFVVPIALGLAGTVLALTVLRIAHADLLPYGAPLLTWRTFAADGPALLVPATLAPHEWISLVWVALMLVFGPLWLRRRLA
ncbi:ABC transporter permease [Hymenobacter koreensis]|uniref:ABC transporter permease n=1 Tax=Hymenobacter koreensis TaxID=1084523 RepID=A0ABP8JLF0_9BACT